MKKYLWFLIAMLIFCTPIALTAETAEDGNIIENVEEYFTNTVVPQNQSDEDPSNDNIQIDFDEKTGTLTVSGKGVIDGFFSQVWKDLNKVESLWENKNIKKLIIGEGITLIRNSFNDLRSLKEVQYPENMERIYQSFNDCDSLKKAKFTVNSVSQSFNHCDKLKKIEITSKTVHISFRNCKRLRTAHLGRLLRKVYYSFDECPRLRRVICGKRVFTKSELWKEYTVDEEDYSVYWEDTTGFKPTKTYPKKYVYIVPGGIMVFAFGVILLLSKFIKKKK